MEDELTTIAVYRSIHEQLTNLKVHHRESMNDVISRLIEETGE